MYVRFSRYSFLVSVRETTYLLEGYWQIRRKSGWNFVSLANKQRMHAMLTPSLNSSQSPSNFLPELPLPPTVFLLKIASPLLIQLTIFCIKTLTSCMANTSKISFRKIHIRSGDLSPSKITSAVGIFLTEPPLLKRIRSPISILLIHYFFDLALALSPVKSSDG